MENMSPIIVNSHGFCAFRGSIASLVASYFSFDSMDFREIRGKIMAKACALLETFAVQLRLTRLIIERDLRRSTLS